MFHIHGFLFMFALQGLGVKLGKTIDKNGPFDNEDCGGIMSQNSLWVRGNKLMKYLEKHKQQMCIHSKLATTVTHLANNEAAHFHLKLTEALQGTEIEFPIRTSFVR